MVLWEAIDPRITNDTLEDVLGIIPMMINDANHLPAWKQFDNHYQHGGGWRPFKGFRLIDKELMELQYPGDPVMKPLVRAKLRDETIYVYPHAWVLIVQPDWSFEICRMD